MKKFLNIKIIIRTLGFLLLFQSFFMLLASFVSFLYNESDVQPILLSAGITLTVALIAILSISKPTEPIGKREAYLVVALVWVVFSLFGLLPFLLSGSIPSFTDAFFETMSGFTTTGATILTDVESLSHGLLFWRSIIQWLGGMGIIVLSLAILPLLGMGGMQLFVAEVPGPTKDKLHAKVSFTAKALWGIYVVLTASQALFLWLGGMDLFDGICHSFTTMATGGFSTKNASIAYWNSPLIEYIIIVYMFLAGVNFSLYFSFLQGNFSKIFKNEELKYYLSFVLVFTLLVVCSIVFYTPELVISVEQIIRHSLFQVVSLFTTTGFATYDYLLWSQFTWMLLIVTMLFGASAGSTSGGIKLVRIVLLLKNSYYEFKRLLHPNAIIPVRYNEKVVMPQMMTNVLAFVALYITILVIGMIMLGAFGMNFDEAVGSAVTALSNVGPSLGSLGPSSNFAAISLPAKWVMSFLMLIGRLELFTVLVILTPTFWSK
ncbi:MAG: TrkH family potassium uptake protein [Paludibacteraceae bacterium]|nr:TrkH family potassium uptake protein [Paludibacteraceae bacterium]